MSPPPITRKDLPYFEVESIEEGPVIPASGDQPEYPTWRIRGIISAPTVVDPSRWCALLGLDRNCLYGEWLAKPDSDHKVEFETTHHPKSISAGSHLPFAGDLDAWAAILIEDGPDSWEEHSFVVSNAIATRFLDKDGQPWRTLVEQVDDQPTESGSEVVIDGWDHEHCLICNAHIDPGDRFFKHKSATNFCV
jgi:hypothetical protein